MNIKFRKYHRISIRLSVEFAQEQRIIRTLEGEVTCQAGDAIVTGVKGEQWPVSRERFAKTYKNCNEKMPMGGNGIYCRKPMNVLARQIEEHDEVSLSYDRGVLKGKPGDWLVLGPEGDHWIVDGEVFSETYIKVGDDERE